MNIEEFFFWLKGFSEAANPYNVTPKQWEAILEKLNEVEAKKEYIGFKDFVKNKSATTEKPTKSSTTYPLGIDSIKVMLID